jgi:hypothetical protein
MIEETTGNSMPDEAAAEEGVFDSSDTFFDALDNEVSGAVLDQDTSGEVQEESNEPIAGQATQQNVDPGQATGNDTIDWEKRYKDSSREAQRLNAELSEFEPIKPLVSYMKRDSGLVDTIRGYLQNGGKTPESVQDTLNLSEDFVFDGHEAVTDGKSESAKVLNQMVENTVQRRVDGILEREKAQSAKIAAKNKQVEQAQAFMKKNNMSETEFGEMLQKVKTNGFSYEDMYYLMNRDKAAKNVATSTKNEMLGQMKNAREIPASQGATNNAGAVVKSADDSIFDTLLSSDGGLDDLFS